MIFKFITKRDSYRNLTSREFSKASETPFKTQETKFSSGHSILTEYVEFKDMAEIDGVFSVNYFDNYTDYSTFLISAEAEFKAEVSLKI